MTATAKQWKRYQAVRASLEPDQQNVLSGIEEYAEPGITLVEVDVFNDHVNAWRGGEYTPAENKRFLDDLGSVDIGDPNEPTVQSLFDGVRLYRRRDGRRLAIRLSDYYSEVIGAYISKKEEE